MYSFVQFDVTRSKYDIDEVCLSQPGRVIGLVFYLFIFYIFYVLYFFYGLIIKLSLQ